MFTLVNMLCVMIILNFYLIFLHGIGRCEDEESAVGWKNFKKPIWHTISLAVAFKCPCDIVKCYLTLFKILILLWSFADGDNVIVRETSCLSPELCCGADEGRTFPTFKTDAITKIDSQSSCTSAPEFSFSFSSLQDFTLADCLKMPFVRGPFWLRKKSISYGEQGKKNQNGASCITSKGTYICPLQLPEARV